MKRLFILATAAIVALASCTKTQVVYNEAPQEIGFKAVTGVMTKAGVQTLGDNNTMGVFANLSSGKSQYFGNTCFVPVQGSTGDYEWVATPDKKYWPLNGTLDFAVYSPFVDGDETVVRTYTDSPAANSLEIKVDNSITVNPSSTETATLASKQTDWLYGEKMLTSAKTNDAMAINLKHALAKITIKVTSDLAGLTITSLQLTGTKQIGTLTITYSGDTSSPNWTNTGNPVSMTFVSDFEAKAAVEAGEGTAAIEADMDAENTCYVIPSNQTSIEMSYKLPSSNTVLTYTHDFNPVAIPTSDGSGSKSNVAEWVANKHYTYDIQITANEIKFAPTEEAWDTPSTTIDVDPNKRTNPTPAVES